MGEGCETIHAVFGCSVAQTLRQALMPLGPAQRVVGLRGMLSVGSIDPPDEPPGPAWAEATAPGIVPIFWACLSEPAEHACFLAFAARMRDRRFDLVDATNLDFTTADGVRSPCSLGLMRAQDIAAAHLLARRRAVPPEERHMAAQAWSRLQLENAPFRIVRDGRLVSADLTHYDALLTGQARPDWETAIQLIGRAVTTFFDCPRGDGTDGDVLFSRLLTLGKAGAVEIKGPGPGMHDYQVRRPPR